MKAVMVSATFVAKAKRLDASFYIPDGRPAEAVRRDEKLVRVAVARLHASRRRKATAESRAAALKAAGQVVPL